MPVPETTTDIVTFKLGREIFLMNGSRLKLDLPEGVVLAPPPEGEVIDYVFAAEKGNLDLMMSKSHRMQYRYLKKFKKEFVDITDRYSYFNGL